MDQILNDLTCPITLELFDDPINVPCCGKVFSRLPLNQHLEYNPYCPMCKGDLESFDPLSATKNVVISSMVESLLKLKTSPSNNQPLPQHHRWKATLSRLKNHKGEKIPIGELKLNLEDSKFSVRPSLFICVVDRSGSMGGNPFKQVETALIHIMSLTQNNPCIKTKIIGYASSAEIIQTSGSFADITRVIRTMYTGGGTNFTSAFNKIRDILSDYIFSDLEEDLSKENNISHVTIAFLTDGESGEDRSKLVTSFKNILKGSWVGPTTVHSIGFGKNCDKILLEELRKSGSNEGVFRYSEPTDSGDALCNKLTSLFELVSQNSTVQVELRLEKGIFKSNQSNKIKTQFPITENNKGCLELWINLESEEGDNILEINSCLDKGVIVPININFGSDYTLFEKWCHTLVDELAFDVLELSKIDKNKYGQDAFNLHTLLLEQRGESISSVITSERLQYILQDLNNIKKGIAINSGKLLDLRFGSLYQEPQKITVQPKVQIKDTPAWKEMNVRYSRNNNDKDRNLLQQSIMNNNFNSLTNETKKYIDQVEDINYRDIDGNTALMLACYCGQSYTIEYILKKFPDINLDLENNDHETSLTLAIKARGFWKSIKILINCGANVPSHRIKTLERYAIDMGYRTTANLIGNFKDPTAQINETMSNEYIMFSYEKAINNNFVFDVQNYLRIAIVKQMSDLINILIEKHSAVPTISMLMGLCIPDSSYHLNLIKQLLEKVNLNEADQNGDTLLFRASEKGSLDHVKLFISKGAKVDQPNNLGNTPLWIACWKRYPCIISYLIDSGADVNKVNLKGNPPIVSICQMGPKKIAEQLLARGATVDHINNNGDSMILICCRNGQHEVLKLLLDVCDPKIATHRAHIDGFSPILASTEANRPECIKVLCEYGVDLEEKTDYDNPILQEATPLHLAAYYGRLEAAQTLLSLGTNPNSKDKNNQTPLHIAVIQNQIGIIKLLKNKGANLLEIDNFGQMPISYCRNNMEIKNALINPIHDILTKLAKGESKEVVNCCFVLLKYAKTCGVVSSSEIVDTKGPDGKTPLMEAIIHSNYDLVKVLLQLGADLNHQNNVGLNSHFWSQWIGNQRIKQLLNNSADVSIYIDRLKKLSTQDSQFAYVLYLGSKPNMVESIQKSIGLRMSTYINCIGNQPKHVNISQDNILDIKEEDIKLMDIVETTKHSSILEDQLKREIWDGKILAVNLLASKITNLSPLEIMAIYLYPTFYEQIFSDSTKILNNYFYKGLGQLPAYTGEVFIGSESIDRTIFQIGKEFTWDGCISGSTLWGVAIENIKDFKKSGTVLIIKSKSGRFIGQYSKSPQDSEVVILPGKRYSVTNWYRGDVIALGQSNIREHTFGIKKDDLEKMIFNNKPLIIEIDEKN